MFYSLRLFSIFRNSSIGQSWLYEVKYISSVSLLNNVISILIILFFKSISQFLSFIWLHCREERDFLKEIFIFLSLSICSIFHNVIEGLSIQDPKKRRCVWNNGCCSWSVIEKSQFSKCLSRFVSLQKRWFFIAWEQFKAAQFSTFNYIQAISMVSLLDNGFLWLSLFLWHCINDYFFFSRIQSRKHKCII